MNLVTALFFVVLAAVLGGFIAKLFKVPSLVGFIIAGATAGMLLPEDFRSVSNLAQLGTILLLFSIGVELSFERLAKFLNVAVFGASLQIILVTAIVFGILRLLGINATTSLILAAGFSLSSTAVVVKILSDRGEIETIHGGVMLGWLLVQDLAVIPMMVILPVLGNSGGEIAGTLLFSLGKAFGVVAGVVLLGKLVVPFLLHKVAEANSRELLLLLSLGLALGTAAVTSLFGISPALGAFLAGIVISESQEHHAIFAETRPLRDLFVALFFVTLGFLIIPGVVLSKFGLIVGLSIVVIIIKIIVTFFVSVAFGFRGKSAIASSFGLAQVGEFAFVIFSTALALNLIDVADTSIGISVTLLTLVLAPILFNMVLPVWRWLRKVTLGFPGLNKLFTTGERKEFEAPLMESHIIICGYGRVGKWVGKALGEFGIPFVVVEYDQNIVNELKDGGISVLYGDPTEPEVLEAVGIRQAKAVILAIPDRVAQETLIAYVQTVAPEVKIISRAHLDEDWNKLKNLRVDKVVQPEFEAAVEIVRSVLIGRGKNKEEVTEAIKSLRVSHSK